MYMYKTIKLKNGKTRGEHRLIMERHIGRVLEFNEVVHHRDGDKRNNVIENLEVMSRSEHMALHKKKGDIVVRPLTLEQRKHLTRIRSKVTEEQAKRIKYMNEKPISLCTELGIHKQTISAIRNGHTWTFV